MARSNIRTILRTMLMRFFPFVRITRNFSNAAVGFRVSE